MIKHRTFTPPAKIAKELREQMTALQERVGRAEGRVTKLEKPQLTKPGRTQ